MVTASTRPPKLLFLTILGHFFVNYMNIIHKIEVQTVILRAELV